MTIKTLILPVSAALLMTACATAEDRYNNMSSAERGAVLGTAVGAGAGAIVAGDGDDAEGALIGAGIGAAAGYMLGNERDKRRAYQPAPGYQTSGNIYSEQNRRFDTSQQRYYFVDPATGAEYWANGERRR